MALFHYHFLMIQIIHQGEENTTKYEENGEVVLVTENRNVDNGARHGDIVISGTPDRLIKHLIEDRSPIDMTYDEVRVQSVCNLRLVCTCI